MEHNELLPSSSFLCILDLGLTLSESKRFIEANLFTSFDSDFLELDHSKLDVISKGLSIRWLSFIKDEDRIDSYFDKLGRIVPRDPVEENETEKLSLMDEWTLTEPEFIAMLGTGMTIKDAEFWIDETGFEMKQTENGNEFDVEKIKDLFRTYGLDTNL